MNKKQIRKEFRKVVFNRDKHLCRGCGKPAKDAHHIIDRNEIANGGYVLENGISLCEDCHIKAEVYHQTGEFVPGFSPEELFAIIDSSLELAIKASEEMAI